MPHADPAALGLPADVHAYPAAHVHGAGCAVPPEQNVPALHRMPAAVADDAGQKLPPAHVHGDGCAAPPAQKYDAGHANPLAVPPAAGQ
jgi:hypothetical protein